MKSFFCKLIKVLTFGKLRINYCQPKVKKSKNKKIKDLDIPITEVTPIPQPQTTKKVLRYTK